jgi:hypothetical protein
MSSTIFLGQLESLIDVMSEFEPNWTGDDRQIKELKASGKYSGIVLAYYDMDGYEGSAFVLLLRDGELWEVNGSHCSCYGLENQWNPEPTTREALLHRITKGTLGEDSFGPALKYLLENWNGR